MSRSRSSELRRIATLIAASKRVSRNDPRKALLHGLEALSLARSLGLRRRMIESQIILSVLHLGFCDYPAAVSCLDAASELIDPEERSPELVKILLNYGAVYRELGRYHVALDYFIRATAVAEELDQGALQAVGLYNCGVVHGAMGDLIMSLECMLRAIHIWSREDPPQAAVPHYDIALSFERVGLTDKALEYLRSSYELYRRMPNRQGEAVCLAAMGRIHLARGDDRSAEGYLRRALAMTLRIGARSTEITIRRTLAGLHRLRGLAGRADRELEIAAGIARETGSAKQRIAIGLEIAVHLRDRHEYARAIEALQAALADALETSDASAQITVRQELTSCYEQLGMLDRVVEQLKEIVALHARSDEQSLPVALALIEERTRLRDAAGERDLLRLQQVMLERETRHLEQDRSALSLRLRRREEEISLLQQRMRRESPGADEEDLSETTAGSDRDVCVDFVHQIDPEYREFARVLALRFGSITPAEMKLCCLLRANLATKEVSRLMCVAPKTVEVYRTRIRRKLGLGRSENLIMFLQAIG